MTAMTDRFLREVQRMHQFLQDINEMTPRQADCPTSAPLRHGLRNAGFLAHRSPQGAKMGQKSNSTPVTSENLVRNIRRATRKHHAAEEKIRIVMLSAMPSRWHSSAIEVSPRRPSS